MDDSELIKQIRARRGPRGLLGPESPKAYTRRDYEFDERGPEFSISRKEMERGILTSNYIMREYYASGGTRDDLYKAIAARAPLDAYTILLLIHDASVEGTTIADILQRESIGKTAAANASEKGRTWRRIAIAQFNDPAFTEPGTSIPKFAETIAGEVLEDSHGKERAPGFRRVCDVLRKAKIMGELKG